MGSAGSAIANGDDGPKHDDCKERVAAFGGGNHKDKDCDDDDECKEDGHGSGVASTGGKKKDKCDETEPPKVDVCPNIPGDQETIPEGKVKDENGDCVTPTTTPPVEPPVDEPPVDEPPVDDEPTVAGTEGTDPPDDAPDDAPEDESDDEPTVLGTEATTVPTAVDAGLAPSAADSGPGLLAYVLVGLGLALMIAAGLLGLGGRGRGAHQV